MAREGALILLFAYRSPPRISEEANPVDTFLNFPRFKVRGVFLVLRVLKEKFDPVNNKNNTNNQQTP